MFLWCGRNHSIVIKKAFLQQVVLVVSEYGKQHLCMRMLRMTRILLQQRDLAVRCVLRACYGSFGGLG